MVGILRVTLWNCPMTDILARYHSTASVKESTENRDTASFILLRSAMSGVRSISATVISEMKVSKLPISAKKASVSDFLPLSYHIFYYFLFHSISPLFILSVKYAVMINTLTTTHKYFSVTGVTPIMSPNVLRDIRRCTVGSNVPNGWA